MSFALIITAIFALLLIGAGIAFVGIDAALEMTLAEPAFRRYLLVKLLLSVVGLLIVVFLLTLLSQVGS